MSIESILIDRLVYEAKERGLLEAKVNDMAFRIDQLAFGENSLNTQNLVLQKDNDNLRAEITRRLKYADGAAPKLQELYRAADAVDRLIPKIARSKRYAEEMVKAHKRLHLALAEALAYADPIPF